MRFDHKHLLGIEPLRPEEITTVLALADQYVDQNRRAQKHYDAQAGLPQIHMAFENSTRTPASFADADNR